MRIVYNILTYLLTPITVLRLYWRARKAPNYKKRIRERFARFDIPKEKQGGIWVHAVSVGEVLAAQPFIKALLKEHPDLPMTVTCTTPTGSERIQASFANEVFHVYSPYDLPCVVNKFLNKVQPKITILIETELWPNLLHYCRKKNIPTLLANARLSARSAKGYASPMVKSLSQQMMKNLSIIAAQAQADANRFIDLGANKNDVKIVGNIKFDFELPQSLREAADMLKSQLGNSRPIWIAASTHEGEDEKVLAAHKKLCELEKNALLILVPRHPERFDKVANLCEKAGFKLARRSKQQSCDADTGVYLGDTMGELRVFFGASDVAFIGGSFVPVGGHNMLEAALYHIPVLSGPQVFNFAKVSELLIDAKGMKLVDNEEQLFQQVHTLFNDTQLRETMGNNAAQVVIDNRGALDKHMRIVAKLLKGEPQ